MKMKGFKQKTCKDWKNENYEFKTSKAAVIIVRFSLSRDLCSSSKAPASA